MALNSATDMIALKICSLVQEEQSTRRGVERERILRCQYTRVPRIKGRCFWYEITVVLCATVRDSDFIFIVHPRHGLWLRSSPDSPHVRVYRTTVRRTYKPMNKILVYHHSISHPTYPFQKPQPVFSKHYPTPSFLSSDR